MNGEDVSECSRVHSLSNVRMYEHGFGIQILNFRILDLRFRADFGFRIRWFGSVDQSGCMGRSRAIIDWWRPCN